MIGGGVAGTSVAYHLAALGWTDTVVLERDQLTSGSTFHSAGLVGQLRSSVTLTRMMMYGSELYRRLGAETGHDPGWREVGSLRLASTPTRLEELRRQAGWAATFGLALELVGTAEALELFHGLFEPAGVLGAAFLPTDGQINPSDLAMSLAAGARSQGVEVATGTRVTAIGVTETAGRRRVTGVETDRGSIECDVVVNAGGIYSHEIGRLAGVEVPVVPMAHQYAITRPRQLVPSSLPTMRDPDRLVYFREEVGGMIVGGYERNPIPWCLDGRIPPDFNNRLLDPDWDRFAPLADAGQQVVPALVEADVIQLVNGPEAFTPDGEFILGESEVAGFFVAAGFCAHGIAGAGGVGRVIAEWIVEREPPMDLWKMDVRRFGPQYGSGATACAVPTRCTAPTTTSCTRTTSARPGGRCAPRRRTDGTTSSARRSARRAGGAGQLVRQQRRPRPRVAATPGVGRRALVHRHRDGGARHEDGCGLVRRVQFRQAGADRARCCRPPAAAVREPGRQGRRLGHLHLDAQPPRRDRVRRHRDPSRRRAIPDRHRHRVRPPRPVLDRGARGLTMPWRYATSLGRWRASGCGARRHAGS